MKLLKLKELCLTYKIGIAAFRRIFNICFLLISKKFFFRFYISVDRSYMVNSIQDKIASNPYISYNKTYMQSPALTVQTPKTLPSDIHKKNAANPQRHCILFRSFNTSRMKYISTGMCKFKHFFIRN